MRLGLAAFVVFCACALGGGAAPAADAKKDAQLTADLRPAEKVAFPAIKDWSSLKITVRRGACGLNICPDYLVELKGDGTVTYTGNGNVAVRGAHVTHISTDGLKRLYRAFQDADFFWLYPSYESGGSDMPTTIVEIAFDGQGKAVSFYGLPSELPLIANLADRIAKEADIDKWVEGTAAAFVALKQEGWDFKAKRPENDQLLETAAGRGSDAFVLKLLDAGLPVTGSLSACWAVAGAVSRTRAKVLRALLRAGAPMRWPSPSADEDACDAVYDAAEDGVPRIVELLLAQKPAVDWHGADGCRLLNAVAENDYGHPDDDRPERNFPRVARLLLAAGVDVNCTEGRAGDYPALMLSHDAELTRMLLKAGADPWISVGGKTALDVARMISTYQTIPVLEAWMKAHPKPAS